MRWRGYALLQGWWRWRWRRRRGGRSGGHCAILHVDGGRGVTPTEHLSEMAARSLDSIWATRRRTRRGLSVRASLVAFELRERCSCITCKSLKRIVSLPVCLYVVFLSTQLSLVKIKYGFSLYA